MPDREKVIRIIDELIFEAQKEPKWKAENALRCLKKELLKEQEAKTGHWIWLQYCANEGVYCSECHTKMFNCYPMKKKLSQFCGHCGAKMDDEVEGR